MSIFFNSSHIKTLSELQAIAEKHNCTILFSVKRDAHHPDDYEITDLDKERNAELRIIDEKNIDIEQGVRNSITMTFELVELNKEKNNYHVLVYERVSGFLEFNEYDFKEKLTEEEQEEFYNDYENYVSFDYTDTRKYGFNGVDYKVNIYREGIMLNEFANLTCDYLKEPRIVRNY